VQKKGSSEEKEFDIVGPEEASMLAGKISNTSPLGTALLGTKKGETFTFETPGGSVEYKVLDIK
jgi:transcription elongation factor GreA